MVESPSTDVALGDNVIPPTFYFVSFLAFLFVLVLIFREKRAEFSVLMVVALSVVIHSFFYLVYGALWSSDLWQYLAEERWIYDGNSFYHSPNIMKILLSGKTLHSGLYSVNIIVAKMSSVDLYWVTLILTNIFVSIFIPLILFEIGKLLYPRGTTFALLLSLLPCAFSPTLSWNSVSSSNSLASLLMLFSILLCLAWLKGKNKHPFLTANITALFSAIQYALTGAYSVLFAIATAFLKKTTGLKININKRAVLGAAITALVVSLIPVGIVIVYEVPLANLRSPSEYVGLLTDLNLDYPYPHNSLLVIPFGLVYLFMILGLFKGVNRFGKETYFLFAFFLCVTYITRALFTGSLVGRLNTVSPYFELIFVALGMTLVLENSGRHLSFQFLKKNLRIKVKGRYSGKLAAVFLICVASASFIISYRYLCLYGKNPSINMVEAADYVIADNKGRCSIVFADKLTNSIIAASSHSEWGNDEYGDAFSILEATNSLFYEMINKPSLSYIEAARTLLSPYFPTNVSVYRAYFVYAPEFVGYSSSLVADATNVFGTPKIFGDVYVFSVDANSTNIAGTELTGPEIAPTNSTLDFIVINNGTEVYLHNNDLGLDKNYLQNSVIFDSDKKAYLTAFYVDNDREEINPVVLTDDEQDKFWTPLASGNGTVGVPVLTNDSIEKVKGSDSLGILVRAGSYGWWQIQHKFNSAVDWSDKDFLCLYWYGDNTGYNMRVALHSQAYGWYQTSFIDDFAGWRRLILPFNEFNGARNTESVNYIVVDSFLETGKGVVGTWYLDRVVVDVGNWGYVELNVPDNVDKVNVYSWDIDSSTYKLFLNGTQDLLNSENIYFLDGSSDLFGNGKGARMYNFGYLGEKVSVKFGEPNNDQTLSNNYGTNHKAIFGIELPPAEGGSVESNSTISQMKLAVEVYCATDMMTAYTWDHYPSVRQANAFITYETMNVTGHEYILRLYPTEASSKAIIDVSHYGEPEKVVKNGTVTLIKNTYWSYDSETKQVIISYTYDEETEFSLEWSG